MRLISFVRVWIIIIFLITFFLGLRSIVHPFPVNAVACRYVGIDPKWEVYDALSCPRYGGGSYISICAQRCNYCEGRAICAEPTASNPTPGCEVRCNEGDNTTTGGQPDKDIIWARIFTQDYGGGIRYFGSSQGLPPTVNSLDNTSFKDRNVSINASGGSLNYEGIWAGHFCALGQAVGVTSDGRLGAVKEDVIRSAGAPYCCNATDLYSSSVCYYGEFTYDPRGCSACQFDKTSVYSESCFPNDDDGCEQLANIAPITRYPMFGSYDADGRHPLNKLYHIINSQSILGETADRAMHPWQRYDKTPTYTIINTPENRDYDVRIHAPEGYACYKAVNMVRYDSGDIRYYTPQFKIYSPSENPSYPADGSYCRVTIGPRGGGSYLLLHVRKIIKGHVWGVNDAGNSVGLAGVRVQAYVGNSASSINTYYGEGTTDSSGAYFIKNDSANLQSYQFYSVRVVSSAPAGYTGSATTVRWDDPAKTSGSIPWTWTGSGDTPIGSTSYSGQATYWDNDCSSANREGTIPGGRCDFAFRALPTNNPPTCTLEYKNTSGTYVPYNNSLTWPVSSNVYLRAVGTDPEGNSINGSTYTQTCGTSILNFAEVVAGSNSIPLIYTTPSVPSTCVFSIQMRDSGSNTFGPACSISLNSVVPSTPGQLTLTTSSLLSKNTLSGTVNAIVTAFSNPNAATLSIQNVGICSPSIADCTFNASGTSTLNFTSNGTYPITVKLKNLPFGLISGGNYAIVVNYSPTGVNSSAAIPVADAAPTCGAYTFTTPSPYNGMVQFNLRANDDWSLRSFGSSRLVNVSTNSIVNIIQPYNPTYWPIRSPVTMSSDSRLAPLSGNFSFNAASIVSGSYRIESSLGDTYGNRINCISNIFSIDTTPPVCDATNPIVVQTTSGVVVPSPTDTNNLVIKSTARDANSRLRRVTFYVVPNGTPLANIPSPGVSVYTATVNVPNFATQTIGTPVTVTTPAPGWIVNTTQRNRYVIYAQWEDESGNMPNGANNCSLPYEIGSRYRVNVNVPSDSGFSRARFEDNSTEFKFIAQRNSEPWPALESTTPVPFGSIATGCVAQYPNGITTDDHGLCDSVYVTDTVFGDGNTSNIAIQIPQGIGGAKYSCNQMTITNPSGSTTYAATQLRTFMHSDGQTYCSLNNINFPVQKAFNYPVFSETGVLMNPSEAYPTEVTIQLSYRTDAISGMVFDKNSNVIQPDIIPGGGRPGVTYITRPAGGTYFVLPGRNGAVFDAATFWPSPGNASFTVNTAPDNMCFYEADTTAGLPSNNVTSMIDRFRDRNPGLPYSSNCSITNYPLAPGNLSPVNQNKVNILVAPRLRVGPSDIDFVPNIDSCSNDAIAVAFPYEMKATLSEQGGGMGSSVSTTIPANFGTYNFESVTLNYAATYNILFELQSADDSISLSDFAICSDNNRANPYVFSPTDPNPSSYFNIDNSNYGINYPNVNGAIKAPVRFYLKESNKWWQVYNGGVHSNSKIQIDSNDESNDGMPSQAVIVGDPRPLGHELPKGYDMYTALGISDSPYIAGGLVSSFGFDPVTFDSFGLTDTPNIDNWNVVDFSNPPQNPMLFGNPLLNVFTMVKQYASEGQLGYSEDSSINSAIRKNKAYFMSNSDETINANVNINQPSDPSNSGITTFIDLGGSNTLVIRKNINTGSNILIVYVNGDVLIEDSVDSLNSVFIVATGEITIESAGDDLDNELLIRGGLYGKNVIFERNLSDIPENFLKPASMVMFDQRIINYSKNINFSAEIKESKVYWILKE